MSDPPHDRWDPSGGMIRVLGVPELRRDGVPAVLGGRAAQVCLCLLICRPGVWVPSATLRDAIWDGEPPVTAPSSLRSHLARLRRRIGAVLPDATLVADSVDGATGYTLHVHDEAVDHVRFAVKARSALRAIDIEGLGAREALHDALAMWTGDPFAGIEAAPLEEPRRALRELRVDVAEADARLAIRLGRFEEVVFEYHDLARMHPEREDLCGLVMTALAQVGRRSEALELYTGASRWLSASSGLAPSPALRRLRNALLDQPPT